MTDTRPAWQRDEWVSRAAAAVQTAIRDIRMGQRFRYPTEQLDALCDAVALTARPAPASGPTREQELEEEIRALREEIRRRFAAPASGAEPGKPFFRWRTERLQVDVGPSALVPGHAAVDIAELTGHMALGQPTWTHAGFVMPAEEVEKMGAALLAIAGQPPASGTREDTERLDWLETHALEVDQVNVEHQGDFVYIAEPYTERLTIRAATLREAIDAARAATRQETKT